MSILVSFASIEQAAADTETIAGHVDTTLGDLRAYLAPLVASWDGAAAENYQQLQRLWDTSAEDLNTVLRDIARAVRVAHGNYTSAESTNAGIWQA